jgi:hypothetical protein
MDLIKGGALALAVAAVMAFVSSGAVAQETDPVDAGLSPVFDAWSGPGDGGSFSAGGPPDALDAAFLKALEPDADPPQQPAAKQEAGKPEKGRGGIRIGAFMPRATNFGQDKMDSGLGAGIFYMTEPIAEKSPWRVEIALDAAFPGEKNNVEEEVQWFRVGLAYRGTREPQEGQPAPFDGYFVAGFGFGVDKVDPPGSGPVDRWYTSVFSVGLLGRYNMQSFGAIDARVDFLTFATAIETAQAWYLTLGLWFSF